MQHERKSEDEGIGTGAGDPVKHGLKRGGLVGAAPAQGKPLLATVVEQADVLLGKKALDAVGLEGLLLEVLLKLEPQILERRQREEKRERKEGEKKAN